MNKRIQLAAVAMLCAGALGACSAIPFHSAMNGMALPVQSAQDRVHTAMAALDRGEEAQAKALLEAALQQEPGNATAKRLLDEINIDPRTQLGARNHSYVVRNDDTMSELAQRFLGDPLLFYALARYNNIAPDHLAAGQTILIPDRGRPAPAAPAIAGLRLSTPLASETPSAPAAPTVSADVAQRANRLRLQALEHLNAGDADGAVNLLHSALVLDSSNAAIQRDLLRAQRIQTSLHSP